MRRTTALRCLAPLLLVAALLSFASTANAGTFWANPTCSDGGNGANPGAQNNIGGWQHGTSSRFTRTINGCGGAGYSIYPNGLSWGGTAGTDRQSSYTFVAPGSVWRRSGTPHGSASDQPFSNKSRISAFDGAVTVRRNNDQNYTIGMISDLAGDNAPGLIFGCSAGSSAGGNGYGWAATLNCAPGDAISTIGTGVHTTPAGQNPVALTVLSQCPSDNCTNVNASGGFSALTQARRFQVEENAGPELSNVSLPSNTWINAASSNTRNFSFDARDLVGVNGARVIVGATVVSIPDNTACGSNNGAEISNYTPCLSAGAVSDTSYNQAADTGRIWSTSGSFSSASFGDGTHNGLLRVYDSLYPGGDPNALSDDSPTVNRSEQAFTLRIDRTAPTGTAPAATTTTAANCSVTWTNVADATSGINSGAFSPQYSTDGGATFQAMTGGSYNAAANSYTAQIPASACLGGTSRRVRLAEADVAGNTNTIGGTNGSTVTVTSNGTPSTVVSCPTGWYNTAQTCTATGTAPDGFLRNTTGVDAAPSANSTSNPTNVGVSGEGIHTVNATTTDVNSVTGPLATGQVRIDLTNPTGTAPTSTNASCQVVFTGITDALSGIDPSAFSAQYSTDGGSSFLAMTGGTYNAGAQTYTATIPPAGCQPGTTRRVKLTERDNANNQFVVGGTNGAVIPIPSNGAPTTAVSCPGGWFNTAQTCVVTGTAPDGFLRNTTGVDAAPSATSTTNPTNVLVSSEGVHTVNANTTDVNNVTGANANGTVMIDTTNPTGTAPNPALTGCTVTWTNVDDALSGVNTGGFLAQYSTDGGATFQTMSGGSYSSAAKTYTATLPPVGCAPSTSSRVRLQVRDNATNQIQVGGPTGSTVNIPSAGTPSTSVNCPDGWTNAASVNCSVTGTAPDGFQRNTTGVDASPSTNTTTNPVNVPVSAEGTHTVNATTTDVNGVTGPLASDTVRIDRTNPTGTGPGQSLPSTCEVVWTSVDDALSGIDPSKFVAEYSADGGATWSAMTSTSYNAGSKSYTGRIPSSACKPGTFRVRLRATDNATNQTYVGSEVTGSPNGTPVTYPEPQTPATPPECADGRDNDGDGKVDTNDPACHTDGDVNNPGSYVPTRNESPDPQCADGKDNDGDGKVDINDPACHSDGNANNPGSYTPGGSESPDPECADGKDNDGDRVTDIDDPACHSDGNATNPGSYVPTRSESPDPQCADGKDNDGDGKVDEDDPACHTDGNPANGSSYSTGREESPDPAINVDAACSGNKLRLTDVYPTTGRVVLVGVAPQGSQGKNVAIYFRATGKQVTTAKVQADLSFQATAPLPAGKLAKGNKARYQARMGSQKSLDLKLNRRMFVKSAGRVSGKAGYVTLSGRAIAPLAKARQKVTLRMSGSCAGAARGPVVGTTTMAKNGSFTFTVKIPAQFKNGQAVYLRAQTKVLFKPGSRRMNATYTLVRGIALPKNK